LSAYRRCPKCYAEDGIDVDGYKCDECGFESWDTEALNECKVKLDVAVSCLEHLSTRLTECDEERALEEYVHGECQAALAEIGRVKLD